ncbi:cellulose biosynthesis cyclic di-GMP-binding regulatory protein BcsB [Escherichia coli]|uniref:cellulose biosynthesis cyclic di-GMP-binding regulatory protein BcsB n=1 Tax=Escherichia coli TaxID=562 RepID=UPI000937E987|nr:cellulose biosynthesis cyclic di-GMP-binding regulatory protein BcsB [Escherichia coli]OKB90979.1 cellulose synthase regulator BcsB [Escherichia coli]
MSILTRWLLIPPVNARLIGRYRDYRRHGASAFSATLGCFWMILAWIFIPLEHPRWQRIRAEHKNLYPHINASRPRPLDPVRYLIQTCWLLIGTSRKETPKPRRRAFSGLQNIRGRYHQWMNELPERVSHKTQHLDEKKELGHLSAGARRLILGIIVTFSLILALICVTQPFNPLAQFIFLMLLWGVALIVRRMPGRFSALMLIVLSLTVSCRYIWWRYTSTLNWDDPVSLVCGLILLFAETYAWIVLVLGYFQVVWPLNRQPVPFFDPRDNRTNTLPMVFAGAPDVGLQQASAIVASWFGSRSGWRGQNFPVLYNQLPDRNAIVFATNDKRPDFLRDHPAVKAPVIEMINHPQNPYVKLLVVFGRDDKDLLQAAKGIAQGNILFRGESVVVNEVKPLLPRKPYDAPNWVRTDRPVTFGELKTYEEQLQSSGLEPAAINVSLNLPPDLYLMRSTGIDMDINYRYTMPPVKDSSRMDISLNNQFLQSFNLSSKQEANRLLLRIPVLQGLLDGKTDVSIPALKLGATNQLRFDFEYMNPMPGGSVDNCITFQPVQNHVVIGDDSTIDFSKYYHFIPMPDLRAFANAGFPFSRMADLSQTITVMPKAPNEAQMETLLNTVGFIGAQTGFPAINLTVTDDGSTIQGKDADIMIIGGIPDKLKDDKQIDLLVQATESWVKTPMRQTPFPGIVPDESDRAAETQSTLTSSGAMAAVIGFQSPYNDQRSVIALLADSPRGYEMLNDAVNDSGKRATMFGSVAVIRESGINSLRVGDVYYVGHLPWFERLWYALANHPILLAVLAAISVILLAWVLWRLLRIISRRRLNPDNE